MKGLLKELTAFDKLSNIKRFPTAKMLKQRSVADHIIGCNSIAIVLYKWFKLKGVNFDLQNVIYRIALHDLPEIKTGDIKQPIKHSSKELLDAINKLEEEFVGNTMLAYIASDIMNAKDTKDLEGFIVCLCDILQCMTDAIWEINALGDNADDEMGDCISRGVKIIDDLMNKAYAAEYNAFVGLCRTIKEELYSLGLIDMYGKFCK